MLVPEYDLDNEATWEVITDPGADPSFDRELINIGGLNQFNEPNLIRRWASTYHDPMSADSNLKYWIANKNPVLVGFEYAVGYTYLNKSGRRVRVKSALKVPAGVAFTPIMQAAATLEDVPPHILIPIPKYSKVQLGERRHIIEIYRSPEFLRRSGRYEQTHDNGEAEVTVSCKGCGGFNLKPTGNEDEHVCLDCGSKRQSVVVFNEIKHERLLNDFPARGCYDYFLRLETAKGLYHPADGEALEGIRRLWNYQQKPLKEQELDNEKVNQLAARGKNRRINEIWAN